MKIHLSKLFTKGGGIVVPPPWHLCSPFLLYAQMCHGTQVLRHVTLCKSVKQCYCPLVMICSITPHHTKLFVQLRSLDYKYKCAIHNDEKLL